MLTFWTLVAATLWLLLASNVKLWHTAWTDVEMIVLGSVVYLAVFPTIITFFIGQYATLRLGPTRVIAYNYLIPAVVLVIDLAAGPGPTAGDDVSPAWRSSCSRASSCSAAPSASSDRDDDGPAGRSSGLGSEVLR